MCILHYLNMCILQLLTLLFDEVIEAGDWYDFSENGTIDTADKMAAFVNRVRTR